MSKFDEGHNDAITAFIVSLDDTLAQERLSPTNLVQVPVTFSFQHQHLQVERQRCKRHSIREQMTLG